MTNILNASTYIADTEQAENAYYERGTVEATLHNKTQRVPASKDRQTGELIGRGFVMKYRTGTKVWNASVSTRTAPDGTKWESIASGFDSRSGKHQMSGNIWFASDVTNPANISKR